MNFDDDENERHSGEHGSHLQCETAGCADHGSSATILKDPYAATEEEANQNLPTSPEAAMDRAIESTVVRALFKGNEISRRSFMKAVGSTAAAGLIGSMFPIEAAKAMAKEGGPIEKKDLTVGFIPITCATPIIMAEPMGFYSKHGLNAKVKRAAGWAMVRDWAITEEVDAAHMLSPMPLSISLGAGSAQEPFLMPAVENINGQAITLANKHKGVKEPKDMKGFRFCVPFDYSMHNYLLRYYLAEGGLHPDKDVQIRVVPPPEMVANLRAGNVDGYLAPDPFNQRAVYENVGFIFKLSKDIWNRHPCCAFAISKKFAEDNPNTYSALFRSIVEATHYASKHDNRKEIAKAIAPKNYLNQPVTVLEQVLTGRYADGLGNIQNVPDRIDFDPYPWHSMAIWILTQMKRWNHVDSDFDYQKVAQEVYMASECDDISKELGFKTHDSTMSTHQLSGGLFDPTDPEGYLKSFPINNLGA
ncbi:MAG: ABC transporter substrate-binding protein [Myxococcota bacterium]